jgi:hypothetical protein
MRQVKGAYLPPLDDLRVVVDHADFRARLLQLSKPEQRPKTIDLHRDLHRTSRSRSYRAGREADRS